MTVYPYLEKTAINPVAPITIAKSATFSVYDLNDTGYLTPLNVTRLSDGATVTTLLSDSNGYLPDFTVIDRTSLVIHDSVSGFTKTLVTSAPVPGAAGATGDKGDKGDKGDPGDIQEWAANTFYPLNQVIVNPTGDLVTVTTAHTSTTTYDATKFTLSATILGKVGKGDLIINVKDAPYNAKGDGTTDDTAAIQAAIDAAVPLKATVFMPRGTYKLTQTTATDSAVHILGAAPAVGYFQTDTVAGCLVLRAGVSLIGAGQKATILTTTVTAVTGVITVYNYQDGHIGNFAIVGSGSTGTAMHGLSFEASAPRINSNIRIHDMEISNVGSYGIGHQYGQPYNLRYENLYIHDTGADGIDHKVRYGPLDVLDEGTQGVFFDNILVERIGNRLSDVSGLDVRGQANINNITVRNFGSTLGITTGITLSAGIVNGVDQRSASTKTVLTNFHIDGDPLKQCQGVSILSVGACVVSNGSIYRCAEPTGGGIWIKALTSTPYGYYPGPLISGVVIEGSRGVPGITVNRPNASIIGVKVTCDIQSFEPKRGNISAGQTVFTLRYALDANTIVNKNGVTLVSGTDYTSSGTTLTLTTAAASTDVLDVIAKGASSVYTNSANTTIVGVSTDGYMPGVNISGASIKATTVLSGNSGATNDPTLIVGTVAGGVEITVTNAGTATKDISINPSNGGYIKFGTLTTTADVPITGYITVKDSANNVRKLAVIT